MYIHASFAYHRNDDVKNQSDHGDILAGDAAGTGSTLRDSATRPSHTAKWDLPTRLWSASTVAKEASRTQFQFLLLLEFRPQVMGHSLDDDWMPAGQTSPVPFSATERVSMSDKSILG